MSHLDRIPLRVPKKDPPGGKLAAREVRGARKALQELRQRLEAAMLVTKSADHRAAFGKALAALVSAKRELDAIDDEITEVLR